MTDPDEYRAQIAAFDRELGQIYARRRVVMEAFSDEHPAILPEPKLQTETQRRVARCPRCGGKLE